MKVGDFVICKNSFYDWFTIGDTLDIKLKNLFKDPIFKKGVKYRIDNINYFKLIPNPYLSNSGITYNTSGTTTTSTTTHSLTLHVMGTPFDYSYREYLIDGKMNMVDSQLERIFYTLKEQRQMKLKKIKEYAS